MIFFLFLCTLFLFLCPFAFTQETEPEPIIVNGDKVEYSIDGKTVTAEGNVVVVYKGSRLTCKKLSINTQTKDSVAEGDARLDDQKGVIEGSRMTYNFETKSGIIFDSDFRANPYFGKGHKVQKVSDKEFVAFKGYMTTCSLDEPHYRFKSKKITVFPEDKVQIRDNYVYLGKVPLAYFPRYSHSLKDPLMHVQFTPGKRKDWGPFLLSAWRYNLTENLDGRIYLDYREKLGVAEGFGANYDTRKFGKGDFKYYYTQERARRFEEGTPAEFQRYFIRLRYKWYVDLSTNLTAEYFKIVDSKRILLGSKHNILKDYFFREYEKDTQPLSYALLHHNFTNSSIDFFVQKRINRWYSQAEKLPEIKYSLPSLQIGNSPFYFQNSSSYVNFNDKQAVPSASFNDVTYNRIETTNRFSLPVKAAFVSLTPFISGQDTYTDKSTFGSTHQIVFSTGSDLSTKFYRIFNINTNFLKMDINNLRHIITPTAVYSYTHTSNMPAEKPRFGGGATTTAASVSLGLSNKLQTKRKGQSVDLVDLNVTNTYNIKTKTGAKTGSHFSDFIYKLKILPYSWMSIVVDATYKHSGARSQTGYKRFSTASYDVNLKFTEERSFGFSQRYQRKGGNWIIYDLDWRINPKWKFSFFQRYNRGHDPTLKRGLREQEYTLSRDFHCWIVEFNWNIKRGEGETIWMIFRLKAFPEIEFEYNQSYRAPKPGSQSNP